MFDVRTCRDHKIVTGIAERHPLLIDVLSCDWTVGCFAGIRV